MDTQDNLSKEQIEYAVTFLIQLAESRGLNGTQLHQLSGVSQPTVSLVISRAQPPSRDVLEKLCRAVGVPLADIIHCEAAVSKSLHIYLATPLTEVVRDPAMDAELRRIVQKIKEVASTFDNPAFELYWPGDHTHPVKNPEFSPHQVYLTDRSRASTFDVIILFCAAPSYGVGQENEIATQAGLPGVRLIPERISRMVTGSFLRADDVTYAGSLAKKVEFKTAELEVALRRARQTCFRHRALYRQMNGNDFGPRIETLISDRCGDHRSFAEDLGITLEYLHGLIREPFAVSNPSARLLKRMAVRLGVGVGYLLGETAETDPLLVESTATWHSWIRKTTGLDAALAVQIRDEWMDGYPRQHFQTTASPRKDPKYSKPMREADWDAEYQKKEKGRSRGATGGLF
jgi:transcriptional regulator with XRE-family HTH domain